MSKNIKIGNKIYENVEYISCESADEEGVKRRFKDEDSIEVSKPFVDTRLITDFSDFCSYAKRINLLPYLDTSNGTSFSGMFSNCRYINYLHKDVSQLDTRKGTKFYRMFYDCESLLSIPQIDTINGTDLSYLFSNC